MKREILHDEATHIPLLTRRCHVADRYATGPLNSCTVPRWSCPSVRPGRAEADESSPRAPLYKHRQPAVPANSCCTAKLTSYVVTHPLPTSRHQTITLTQQGAKLGRHDCLLRSDQPAVWIWTCYIFINLCCTLDSALSACVALCGASPGLCAREKGQTLCLRRIPGFPATRWRIL